MKIIASIFTRHKTAKDGQVRSYTSKVSKVSRVSEVSKMSKQGRLACTNAQEISERNAFLNNALASGSAMVSENISFCSQSTVQHDGTRHKATESALCKSLVPQCPVLDLPVASFANNEYASALTLRSLALHARRVSPVVLAHKPAQSARYPDLPTSFAPSVRKSASALVTSKTAAFTLAEVLITLAIIGVVAVLTIPGLIKNHNEKAWSTAQDVFTKRLEIATRQMNTEEKLAGYSSTMDFVNELKKYIKITRVCDNDNITKCFDKEVIWNEGDEPIDMSAIKSAESFGLDWGTDTVAIQFANGVNAVIAYNPNTTQDPYNNQFSATSNSMAILYDVSGNKNPNTNGKDINHINVTELAGVTGCLFPEDELGFCISQILTPGTGYSPMTKAQCEQAVLDGSLGIKTCYSDTDYWAGAVEKCGGINKLLTHEQLITLAKYIYNDDGTMNLTKADKLLSASPLLDYGQIYIWSGQERSQKYAYSSFYNTTYFDWYYDILRSYNGMAVCLGD